MLEDDFTYVIRKALRGLEMAPAQAAERAGLEGAAVLALLAGRWDEAAARALAPVLGLDEAALAAHPQYEPPPCDHPAIARLDLPFGEEQVNAWLIDCGAGKLLIDTGCDAASLARAIGGVGDAGEIRHIIITHNHRDHVGGLGWSAGRDIAIHGPGAGHAWRELRPGGILECGDLQIHAHDLSGHAVPAVGLEVRGLDVPVIAMGDALFAGSMGGCAGRDIYQLARKTLGEVLGNADARTLLLPGHGPATRLDAERTANPFLAAMRIA